MLTLPIASLAIALTASAQQQPAWTLGGTPGAGYTIVSASGSILESSGASLALRSDTASATAFGAITGVMPADTFRMRRVRLVADIDAKGVTAGASPWLRVDGADGMLLLDNGSDNPVKGTGSGRREIILYVPGGAKRLAFGLLLSGRGEATARGLRLEALPRIDPNTPLSAAAQLELDAAIGHVRTQALWRDTVTWSKVEPEVRAMAAGAQSPAEVYDAIRLLLSRLGDHHSFLMKPAATRLFQTGGASNPRPIVRVLTEGVGYISVPGYSGAERNALFEYARGVQDSIAAALPRAGCKWIVDLRGNTGGNMWPMLGGLRPFLGEAGLGSFVRGNVSAPLWHARDVVDVPPSPQLAVLESAYVAVLTGPRTASSGEAVTISFRERPRSRSFGLPTAGLSTANQTYLLPDGAMILLTVSVEADRTGRRYGDKIEPDETVPVQTPADTLDAQLHRARVWLESQPGCP